MRITELYRRGFYLIVILCINFTPKPKFNCETFSSSLSFPFFLSPVLSPFPFLFLSRFSNLLDTDFDSRVWTLGNQRCFLSELECGFGGKFGNGSGRLRFRKNTAMFFNSFLMLRFFIFKYV
ncbi:hypothetical protein RCL_jg264.t1 [Rhizophagus clarus]|uniref:Uncharacterized protein n=1 Tax=Rhizophagus clarus TaxID=94130 RepID=A0A8H3QXS1_9GLOM|nr:hypothetical protein RCL_jg264.t1 [Rhizophagus clarus]